MGGAFSTAFAVVVFALMLVEARRAALNEATQRSRGGEQPAADVPIYKWMRLAYPGGFAAMIAEGLLRGGAPPLWAIAGATVFLVSKAVKWWAILTLGPFWTFRVVIVPGTPLIARGPYRFLRHPNYLGVVGEFVGAALMTGATVSGPLAIVLFGMLLKRRISVEDKALASSARHPPCSL